MPLVRAPNGKVYRLADGLSPEDMKRKIEAHDPGTYPDFSAAAEAKTNWDVLGGIGIGAQRGVGSIAQLAPATSLMSSNERDLRAAQFFSDKFAQGQPALDASAARLGYGEEIKQFMKSVGVENPDTQQINDYLSKPENQKAFLEFLPGYNAQLQTTAKENIKKIEEAKPVSKAPFWSPAGLAEAVTEGAIQTAPTIGAAVLGGPAAGLAVAGLQATPQAFNQAIEMGLPRDRALLYSSLYGTAEAASELLPLQWLFKAGVKPLRRVLMEGLTEGTTEAVNSVVQDLLGAGFNVTPDMTFDQLLSDAVQSGTTGTLLGIVLGGGAAATHGTIKTGSTKPDVGPSAVELDLSAPSRATNSVAPDAMTSEQQAASAPLQVEQTKRLALPAPTPTPEDVAPSVAVTPPPVGETVREKQAAKTSQLLAAAREVTTPIGAFTPAEVGPDIAGKVNLWRLRTGRNIDAPITVEDMQGAKVGQPAIDELVISRKPITKIGSTQSAQQAGEISAQINADIGEQQYNDAVAAVRKAGRFTLRTVQDAIGATKPAEARAIRDQMVERGDLVQPKPNTFKLPEQPKTETTKAAATTATYTVAPAAPETVAVKKDGKIHGTYATQKEAAAAVRAIRAREKETGAQPGKVEIVNGGIDAEGKAMPGRPSYAVYENSYDEAGNVVGRNIVSTHATEEGAAAAARGLNARPAQTATTKAEAKVTPQAKPRSAPSPAAPIMNVPDVIAGREQEIINGLDKLAKQRGLPTLGVKVKLVHSIVDEATGQTTEGSYLNGVVRLALDKLNKDMTVEEIVDNLAEVMDHELIHGLRAAGVLAPGTTAWKVLGDYIVRGKHPRTGLTFLQTAQLSPEEGGYSDMSPTVQVEEAMAEAFRYWAKNRRAVGGAPGTVFNQIARWFKNLVSSIPNDLFDAIEKGSLVRANIKPPASKRAAAVDDMEAARAKAAAATTPQEAAVAQREFLRARDQAEADRVGRVGPRSVLGTTPSEEFMVGPRASFDTVEAVNEKAAALKLAPTPNYGTPNIGFMRKLADAYQNAKHQPSDTAVFKAYSALQSEARALFDALGVKVVPWRQNGQPYINQREMLDDIANKGEVKMRLSAEMFPAHPTRRHPMQEETSVLAADGTALTHDDILRVVAEAYGYSPVGQVANEVGDYRAYHTVKGMFSDRAQKALATEMLAQSAWHNYGPRMRLDDGSIAPEGALGFVEPVKREFAERKATILPDEALVEPAQAEAEDISGITKYSRMRPEDAPKKTVKAYKLFRIKKNAPGQLFPLFVNANTSVPIGEWVEAEVGPAGKNPSKVKSKLGDLAFRPGWHSGDLPVATHIGGRSKATPGAAPDYRPDDQVWAEVEVPADVDWQSVAESRAQISKAGTPIASTAHITDQLPRGGHYRYKTNPNMTGNWIISGAMKVTRVLSDAEVEAINSAAGVADLPRLEQPRYSRGTVITRMQPGGDTPDRISTRQPGTQRGLATQNPFTDNLIIDLNAMKANPAAFSHNMRLLKTYPGFVSRSDDPNQIAEDFINFVVGNLTYLHDRVPADIRAQTKRWYDGARKIAERWSSQFGVPDYVASGVLASLSPQKDWYQNVSLAERVLDIYSSFMTGNRRAFIPTQEMADTAARIYGRADYADSVRTALSGPLMDMPNELTKAMWVRIYDETYNPRGFRKVTPEGEFVGAPEGNVAWGSNVEIAKAISVLENQSYENTSERMGEKHKVRNFFNNILAPNAPWGDVTIDTHAVAAALIRPLSGSSAEVNHNFGTSPERAKQPPGWIAAKNVGDSGAQGTYGIYAEAYRRAAQQLGILPRELQSITWEAVRGLFPAIDKRNATKVQQVLNVWNQVSSGELTADAARSRIEALAGGINDPTWLGPDSERANPARATSYEGELARARVQRSGAGELGAGGRDAAGAGELAAGAGVQGRGGFTLYSRGIKYGPAEASLLDKVSKAKTYNVGTPQFYEMLDEVMPGGKYYGNPDRAAAAVVVPADTSAPNFSRDYDGNVFFGGDISYQQLQMARDGDRGAVMTYMSPEDFLRLADQQPVREQRLYNEAAGAGYKFNTLPSLVIEQGKEGTVRVLNSDGVGIVRALQGQAKSIPVVLYPNGNGQIENVNQLEANGNIVELGNLHEFDIERRGPREGLSTVAFNAWFKQSAVADEAGAPKRMYHNTNAKKAFNIFDTQSTQFGSHFGTVEQAEDVAPKGHSYPVYLSIQNPIRLKDTGQFSVLEVGPQLIEQGVITEDQYKAALDYMVNGTVMLQDALMDAGHDGVVYLNRAEGVVMDDPTNDYKLSDEEFKAKYPEAQDSYIVFQPTQVKSAIANRGTWSAANPDIRYSRSRDRARVPNHGSLVYSAVHDKVDGKIGEFFRNLGRSKAGFRIKDRQFSIFDGRVATQDSFLSVKDMYGKLAKNGIVTPTEIHAYAVEQSIGSKAENQIKKREAEFVQPLIDAIGDGVKGKRFTYGNVLDFLYALHAPERNVYLRERGSKKPDPSGMTDAEAAQIIAEAKAKGTFAELMTISRMVEDIVTDINMTRVRTGQITPAVAASSPFRHWVPLRDTDDVDPYDEIAKGPRADGVGRAFTSWGVRPDKRMFGRKSKAGDIIANLISLQAVTVMRGERARVGKALYETLTTLPNAADILRDDLEILDKPPTKLAYGADGMIREIADPGFRNNPDIVVFKIDGKEVVMRSKDPRLVRALKGPLVEQLHPILQLVSQAARFRAAVITSRDPAFVLTNLSRDAIEAVINSGQYDIPGLAAKVIANIPRSATAIAQYQLGKGETKGGEYREYYKEMEENGWLVSFLAPRDVRTIVQKIHRDVGVLTGTRGAVAKVGKAFDGFMEAWDGVNNVTEGGLRLAFYAELRKAGASIADAGIAAKNLTINFNKGGTFKPVMNSLYLFSSVVMNSVATTGRMLTNKRGQRVLLGVVAVGFLLDALNRALSDDDDKNGIKDYDQLTEDELNRNLILPTRYLWGQDTKLPVAVGPVGAILNMGRNLSRALDGVTNKRQPVSPVASVLNAVLSTVDALNPVGDSGRPANILAPWFVDPFIDLQANKNWADMNIVPQTFDKTKPESQKYYRTTDDIYINVAKGLNDLTGGNEVRGGWFDFSPEQYKYVADFMTGGTGRFLLDSAYAMGDARELWQAGRTDLIQTGRIPVLKRFVPTTAVERGGSDIYYKLSEEVQVTENEMKSADPETRAAGKARVAAKSSVRGAFNQAEAQLTALRAQLKAAQQNKTMNSTARLAKIEEIKNKMQDVMDKAVKRYYDTLETMQ